MIVDHYFDQSISDRIKLLEDKMNTLDKTVRGKIQDIMTMIDENIRINNENNNIMAEYMKEMMESLNRENNDVTVRIVSRYNDTLINLVHKQFENHNKILRGMISDVDKKMSDENKILRDMITDVDRKRSDEHHIFKNMISDVEGKRSDENKKILDHIQNLSEKINDTNIDYNRVLNNAIRNNIPLGFNTTRAIYALNRFTKDKELDHNETKKN